MVIEQKFDLKQLHLRPVRIHFVNPQVPTMFNGPWITHVLEQDSLVRFYHPAASDPNRATLADSLEVEQMRVSNKYYRLYGHLTFKDKDIPFAISLVPYTDEEIAEAILFREQIAYLLDYIKSFYSNLRADGWTKLKLRR